MIMRIIFTYIIFFALMGWCDNSYAQVITTFAGGGSSLPTSVPATSALLQRVVGSTFDKFGNFYFINGYIGASICKVDVSGTIYTIAGNGTAGYSGDNGPATAAVFNYPIGVATDTFGNIYIADCFNHRIRKIDAISGIINTYAGNGTAGFSGDGHPATSASLTPFGDICIDTYGNLFFLDTSNRIRKIDYTGIITTIAGNGIAGDTGNGSLAIDAEVSFAYGICTDQIGNVYFSDHNDVRKIDISTGIIVRIAGNGDGTYYGDGIPATSAQLAAYAIKFDVWGNLWICDFNQRIRQIDTYGIIHTIVGNGIAGFSGDNGSADSAEIYNPEGIALDSCGNLYIADEVNMRIRKVTFPKCGYLKVNNVDNDRKLNIFPNPTYSTITIATPTLINNVTITNMLGQQVYTHNYITENAEIDISYLPQGVYTVRVNNTYVQKLVKE